MDGYVTPDPMVVLIAEDDLAIASMIALVVEEVGARPVVAHDGKQALTLARSFPPTVVITDLMMPRMCGDTLIAALRDEWGANLPVILVSAAPSSRMLTAGADAVLPKPFMIVDLMALLDHYLAA